MLGEVSHIDQLIAELTLDEKCELTAGADMWGTTAIERLKIPSLRMSDGPSGVRGPTLSEDNTSACIPCGSALGATWNTELAREVGSLLGQEAHAKSVRILLAPAINLHRSPLSGRNFECYSEDPFLTGHLAAALIRGVQSEGVAATAKHLVANETEYERHTTSSIVDERILREVYLLPFELAVREGDAIAIMSAYNRLNGIHCGEHSWLLNKVVKEEWGFDGIVMSDWWAIGSTIGSAHAGQDLEMPGPGRYFGAKLAEAVRNGEVSESAIDEKVRRILSVIDRLDAWSDNLVPEDSCSIDSSEHKTIARRAATEATVLLRNTGILPLAPKDLKRVAVIGPNADSARIIGGGSTTVIPHYVVTPLGALRHYLGASVDILHEVGCHIEHDLPTLDSSMLTNPDKHTGLCVEFFNNEDFLGEVIHTQTLDVNNLSFIGSPAPGVNAKAFSVRAKGSFTPTISGIHTFGLIQKGQTRLYVDRQLVIDGFAPATRRQQHGGFSMHRAGQIELEANLPVDLTIEISSRGAPKAMNLTEGMLDKLNVTAQIGHRQPPIDDPIQRAVSAATDSDAVILVVGTSAEWESEDRDRVSMDLPGDQDELIRRVLAANKSTIVVVNSGAPVSMPWADDAPAILQSWFGGQEMSNALAEIIFGDAEPGGRLATTIPLRLEHNPSYGNFPGENDEVRYGEGLLVGYRWYDSRSLPTRFPFGYGLSYTSFSLGQPVLSTTQVTSSGEIHIELSVTNTGTRAGSEVVQCYVRSCEPRLFRPTKELKAFQKVRLEAGQSHTINLKLNARSFSYWDPGNPGHEERLARAYSSQLTSDHRQSGWYLDAGVYELHIGRSIETIDHVVHVSAPETARIS